MSLAGHPPRDLYVGWPASDMQQSDDHGVGVRGNSGLQRFSITKEGPARRPGSHDAGALYAKHRDAS